MSLDLSACAASRNPEPPVHLGTRYGATGTFLPEPGNTVICHLQPGSETERALTEAQERFRAMSDADRLVVTPAASLHMTLFQGIIEYRRTPGFWPRGVPLDLSIDEMTALMGAALADFPAGEPFRVEVTGARPTGLVVAGAGPSDRQAMQAWRDAFADLWGYRHPDHDTYVFHITFAYLRGWLDDARLPAWQAMLDEVISDITRRAPLLELRPPAFCSFADMNHFEELHVFGLRS